MKEAFEKLKKRLGAESDKWLNVWNDASKEGTIDNYADGMNDAFDEAFSIVSEVEAECGNGWIPCSERLPEKSGRVLVSYESINDEIAVSETSYDYKRKTFWISPCVIAWMPLPSPYTPTTD